MSQLKEKVASLKELANSLSLNNSEEQSKLISSIIDTLDVFAEEIGRLDSNQVKMQEQVNTIDEDLGSLEDEVYENENFEDELIEISCPHCDEIISFTEEEISEEDEVECPVCHKTFEVEWEYECDCDCDDCNDKKD